MKKTMTAIEMAGTIDENRQLKLDGLLPIIGPKRVRVLVLSSIEENDKDDWDEAAWLQAASRNPSFSFLHDAQEDLYTVDDGKPFHDEV
jgi:hypothetical protein